MAWFDANTIDPAAGGTSFPVGRHPVVIKSSAVVATKDNTGGMLALTCEIIDGQFKGVQGPYRLNLWNSNPQSAEIASKQLSAICHVVGTFQLNAEPKGVELFGKPFFIVVEQQPAPNDKYTQIVGVQDINGNAPVKGQGPSQPAQQQQQQPQQPMQQPQPGWQPQGQQPAQQPAQQPGWAAPQQPQQPQQQPQGQPSWSAPGQGGAPPQQPAQQQPSWSQQPPGGATPSWASR